MPTKKGVSAALAIESSDGYAVPVSDGKVPARLEEAREIFQSSVVEECGDVDLRPADAERLKKFMSHLRLQGSAGVRLICAGDACEYRKTCPLWLAKDAVKTVADPADTSKVSTVVATKAPTGRPCPIEASVVVDVLQQFGSHPRIDMGNPIHRSYVNELCQLASLEWRCNMLLGYDFHGITQEVVCAISPVGDVYKRREMNQIVEVLTRVQDRRSRIFRELTITPEAEAKRRALEAGAEDSLSRAQAAKRSAIKDAERRAAVMEIPERIRQQIDGERADNSGEKK